MYLTGIILIIIVISLYALWIIYTHRQSGTTAQVKDGKQEFNILVKGVYSPSTITAKSNQPIKINFNRQESTDCSRFVIFSDFKIRKELPQHKITTIELPPTTPGTYTFTCDMGMYQGKLIIT